VVDPY
jgi:hypothetical protein